MEEHCREGAPWGAPIVSGAGAGMDRRLILACSTGRMLMLMLMEQVSQQFTVLYKSNLELSSII